MDDLSAHTLRLPCNTEIKRSVRTLDRKRSKSAPHTHLFIARIVGCSLRGCRGTMRAFVSCNGSLARGATSTIMRVPGRVRFGCPARGSGCSRSGRTPRSTRALNWPFGAPDPSSRVVESGAEDPGSRRGRWIRCCCSDRSNFGKPFDCVLVVPADGGFPCGRACPTKHLLVKSSLVRNMPLGDAERRRWCHKGRLIEEALGAFGRWRVGIRIRGVFQNADTSDCRSMPCKYSNVAPDCIAVITRAAYR
jgi:hypothetical protein